MHIHHFICVCDLNTLGQFFHPLLPQHIHDLFLLADEYNLCTEILSRLNRAHHRRKRCIIAAHCIENDLHTGTSFSS